MVSEDAAKRLVHDLSVGANRVCRLYYKQYGNMFQKTRVIRKRMIMNDER